MKRLLSCAMMLVAIAAGYSATVADESKEKEFKATCPVSGGKAKESSSVEFLGKKLYFCCNNCPKAYKKDTAKFAGKARAQLAETGQVVAVACPFTGGKINPDTAITVGGAKVAFCCNNCKGKAQKSDDAVTLVFGDAKAFAKGYTLQNKCPVSGRPIDVTKTVDYKGKKAYFCCPNCAKAFEADPSKFASKLPQLQDKG